MQPLPAKPLGADVKTAYEAKPVNLDALFDGANPFEGVDGPVGDEPVHQKKPKILEEEDGSGAGF